MTQVISMILNIASRDVKLKRLNISIRNFSFIKSSVQSLLAKFEDILNPNKQNK